VAQQREAPKQTSVKPIGSVLSQGVYTPDPPEKKLQATKAAMFDKRPGSVKVGFCVAPSGKTTEVKIKKRFPGDPKVDQICMDTVKKWRFKPFLVGGKPLKTCSTMTFDIKFNR
jgi:protein TonB